VYIRAIESQLLFYIELEYILQAMEAYRVCMGENVYPAHLPVN